MREVAPALTEANEISSAATRAVKHVRVITAPQCDRLSLTQ